MRSYGSLLASAGVALLAALSPDIARAQQSITLSFTTTVPDRTAEQPLVSHNVDPTAVSFDDCAKNVKMTYHTLLGGAFAGSGAKLQVWASVGALNCSDVVARTPKGPGSGCNLVAPEVSVLKPNIDVDIYGRDVVWAGQPPESQSTDSSQYQSHHNDTTACFLQRGSAGPKVTLQFLIIGPDNSSVLGSNQQPVTITTDTVGPLPLKRAGAIGIGSNLLKVSWALPSTAESDFAGVSIFMDPPPGHEHDPDGGDAGPPGIPPIYGSCTASTTPTGDSGTTAAAPFRSNAPFDDAGGDAALDGATDAAIADTGAADSAVTTPDSGTSGGTTCSSSDFGGPLSADNCKNISTKFQDGIIGSVVPDAYKVADVGLGTSEQPVAGLINGVDYTFAVAPRDVLGNVGPMTVVGCDYAQDINDFWGNYKGDGGGAGGSSFCALEAPGAPTAASIFLVTLGGAIVALDRRRRKK